MCAISKHFNKKISVIVPMYNSEKHIAECIKSIEQQNVEMEILLVDDGSEDRTIQICEKFERDNPNIFLLKKKNGGVSDARNFGLLKAVGKYITFVDSDDLLPDGALKRMIYEMETNQVSMVCGNHAYLYGDLILPRQSRVEEGIYNFSDVQDNLIDDGTLSGILFGSVWGCLYKNDLLEKNNIKFDKEITKNEDGLFNIEYLLQSKRVLVMNDTPVYYYRQYKNEDNIFLEKEDTLQIASAHIYKVCEKKIDDDSLCLQMERRKISIFFWNSLRIEARNVKIIPACKYLKQLCQTQNINYKCLDYKNMNIGKKGCIMLLHYHLYLLYYILIHCIYHRMKNKVRR